MRNISESSVTTCFTVLKSNFDPVFQLYLELAANLRIQNFLFYEEYYDVVKKALFKKIRLFQTLAKYYKKCQNFMQS